MDWEGIVLVVLVLFDFASLLEMSTGKLFEASARLSFYQGIHH